MRRTMKDKIFGRPIIELPTPHPFLMFIRFSQEETVLYRALEEKFRIDLNHHFQQKSGKCQASYVLLQVTDKPLLATKNYVNFLVKLLR